MLLSPPFTRVYKLVQQWRIFQRRRVLWIFLLSCFCAKSAHKTLQMYPYIQQLFLTGFTLYRQILWLKPLRGLVSCLHTSCGACGRALFDDGSLKRLCPIPPQRVSQEKGIKHDDKKQRNRHNVDSSHKEETQEINHVIPDVYKFKKRTGYEP